MRSSLIYPNLIIASEKSFISIINNYFSYNYYISEYKSLFAYLPLCDQVVLNFVQITRTLSYTRVYSQSLARVLGLWCR